MMYLGAALGVDHPGRLTEKQIGKFAGTVAGWIGFAFVLLLSLICGLCIGNFWMGG